MIYLPGHSFDIVKFNIGPNNINLIPYIKMDDLITWLLKCELANIENPEAKDAFELMRKDFERAKGTIK